MCFRRNEERRRPRPALSGFTLLEVLVAIAILAIVATMVYSSFGTSLDIIDRVGLGADHYREARFVLGRMAEELSMAYRPKGEVFKDAVFVGLDGRVEERDADSIRFTAVSGLRYLPDEKASDLQLLEYRLAADSGDSSLSLLREEMANPLVLSDSATGLSAIGEGVHSFNLRYYDGKEWVDSWDGDSRRGLPLVVEIEVSFLGSGKTQQAFRSWVRLPMARPEGLN